LETVELRTEDSNKLKRSRSVRLGVLSSITLFLLRKHTKKNSANIMLRQVPQWSDGRRTVSARLIEQANFYAIEDVPEMVQALWVQHLGCEPGNWDFFSLNFDGHVDYIRLRRWTLEQSAPRLEILLLELTACPGDNEHGSIWGFSDRGTWTKIGTIVDGSVDVVGHRTDDLLTLIRDFHVIRREFDYDYDYYYSMPEHLFELVPRARRGEGLRLRKSRRSSVL
jgi:hypothetical protein